MRVDETDVERRAAEAARLHATSPMATQSNDVVAPEDARTTSDMNPRTHNRALQVAIYTLVIVAAVVGVYFATRDKKTAPPPAAAVHNHQTPTAADAGRSVMISAADARRIGVTYAIVEVGPLSREVRTVGQITFDETRVKTISPKIDGWVEQLYVNSTGQPVAVGQPLLTIYSPMLVSAQEELLLAKRLERDVS